ncbi:ornithine carbamoyltransferase [Candidatus Micrarchaeota archaeon]|nr:ornithine carbamoyltransferase [Candidatus Micrarchaeota archaeon]
MRFRARNLLTANELSRDDIILLFRMARELKSGAIAGADRALRGKTLALLFEKPSTRTRVSFEVAMAQLGGHSLFLGAQDLQLSRGETIGDTARVLSRYVDGVVLRLYEQKTLEAFASAAGVPVINGLTDKHHPCQALADLYTLWERWDGKLDGRKIGFVGDGGDNVLVSLLHVCSKLGVGVSVGCPKEYSPSRQVLAEARANADKSKAKIDVFSSPVEAAQGADAVYTDVWVSMGQESEREERLKTLSAFQVNEQVMGAAKGEAVFMHCLPAHRGQEVAAGVIDSNRSIVWEQAENRMHLQKALLMLMLGNGD